MHTRMHLCLGMLGPQRDGFFPCLAFCFILCSSSARKRRRKMPLLRASSSIHAKQVTVPCFVNGTQPILPSVGSHCIKPPLIRNTPVHLAELQIRKLRLRELKALAPVRVPAMKIHHQPHDVLRMCGLCTLQKTSPRGTPCRSATTPSQGKRGQLLLLPICR